MGKRLAAGIGAICFTIAALIAGDLSLDGPYHAAALVAAMLCAFWAGNLSAIADTPPPKADP